MKIYAPVKDACGTWASVRFVNGVGETDDPRLIEWFRTHGYKVPENQEQRVERAATVQTEEVLQSVEDVGSADQPDFDSMTPNDLREWMKANGYGMQIKNIRNKEKLLAIIRG